MVAFTIKEAAKILGVESRTTVWNWIDLKNADIQLHVIRPAPGADGKSKTYGTKITREGIIELAKKHKKNNLSSIMSKIGQIERDMSNNEPNEEESTVIMDNFPANLNNTPVLEQIIQALQNQAIAANERAAAAEIRHTEERRAAEERARLAEERAHAAELKAMEKEKRNLLQRIFNK